MTTLIEKFGYKIEFNGSLTWFLTDKNGDCHGYFSTERKAENAFNRTLKASGN